MGISEWINSVGKGNGLTRKTRIICFIQRRKPRKSKANERTLVAMEECASLVQLQLNWPNL